MQVLSGLSSFELVDLGIVNDIEFSQMRQEVNSVEFVLPMNSLKQSATIYWLLCHPMKNTELKVTQVHILLLTFA